jgi:diguanylate cyclase (GGDEF)-like protein
MSLLFRKPRMALAAAAIMAVTLLVSLRSSSWLGFFFPAKHERIVELQELSLGATAHLRGIVTYTDPAGKRAWIQDDTGAIAIELDPGQYWLQKGQPVSIRGTISRPYNSLMGATSVGLSDVEVTPSKVQFELPLPAQASLRTIPDNDKTGIQIQLSGIVRQVLRDRLGRVQLALGDSGQEALVTLANGTGDSSHWVDAKVRITGVGESIYNDKGVLNRVRIWVQDSNDIQIEEGVPLFAPLYTIRDLYRDAKAGDGHRVRLRGRIVATPSATSLLVEDRWGAIAADLDGQKAASTGTEVEVTGFPATDGVRIDLVHSSLNTTSIQPITDQSLDDPQVLTTAASIRGLTGDQAGAALPVQVTGVVTYNDPEWRQMFLQDSTGGIYVKYSGSLAPLEQGQRITVNGITNAGGYAPVVVAPKILILGKTQLPKPIHVTASDASSGILDSQFVEVEGVVHPMKLGEEPRHLTFELYSPFGQVHVYTGPAFAATGSPRSLVDASVRIRGVLGTVFNSRRQLVGYQLSVSSISDVEVLEAASPDPFLGAAVPVGSLLRFSSGADFKHRVKVQGSVTMVGRGFFYVQDDSGGLEVVGDTSALRLADFVELVGYASPLGGYSPVFTDAIVHVVRHDAAVMARVVTAESMLQGQLDSEIVTMEGRLLSVVDTVNGKNLVLQSGALTFNAQLGAANSAGLLHQLEEGSILRLTGVCSIQLDPNKLYRLLGQEPLGFKLLLRSPQDVSVLRPASWWKLQRILAILGILSVTVLAAFVWVTMLQRRVRSQNEALQKAREKADAIGNLSRAMREVTVRDDFTARATVFGSDEIAQLGEGFNKMLSELEKRDLAKLAAEQKLQDLAVTDELTGLPNRRLLADRLSQTLAAAKRGRHMAAVLYIDLDGFKLVNDSLGHTVGDVLLGQVAQRLQSRIRQSDTLARIGGDEFTVILANLPAREEAERVAQTLLEVLTKPFVIENHEITIGASIGISLFPDNAADGTDLLQHADSAMYAAKRSGKNQVTYFTPELGASVRERLSLENQLRGAVARGEIGVHYQPEFDVPSRRLVRFEALARWSHPMLGMIPPGKFIPIAEESGLIVAIGAYIMEQACSEAVKWQGVVPYPVQVAVNVSSLQFARPTFVEEVAELLRHTGLNPELLQIELTESVMLRGAERVSESMKQLRELGVSLAIDDFGTGYSCLGYLPRLPFNALKIDRSFVNELVSRPEIKAMVHSLVTLAHNLNMQVIVEGVETTQQLELIKKMGGNEVQGFLLGRPTANPVEQLKAGWDAMESATLLQHR